MAGAQSIHPQRPATSTVGNRTDIALRRRQTVRVGMRPDEPSLTWFRLVSPVSLEVYPTSLLPVVLSQKDRPAPPVSPPSASESKQTPPSRHLHRSSTEGSFQLPEECPSSPSCCAAVSSPAAPG